MSIIKNRRKSTFSFIFSAVLFVAFSLNFGATQSFANSSDEQSAQKNEPSLSESQNKPLFNHAKDTKLLDSLTGGLISILAENETGQKSRTNNGAINRVDTSETTATFVVNSTADAPDANTTDNVCATAANVCTLRAAIEQANASPGNDVITFASNVKTITLSLGTELLISNAGTLQINGPGADILTISGNNTNRIFHTELATVTIKGATLTAGKASSGNIGGGAVYANGGAVTFDGVHITQNIAGNNPSAESAPGGGVSFNGGTHVVQNSTFSGNKAFSYGGAIYNNSGNLTITNSTFSGNTGYYFGGAIYNNGSLTLRSDTISNNTVDTQCSNPNSCAGSGGGIAHTVGALNIVNTIIAGNTSIRIGEAVPVGAPEIAFFGTGTVVSAGNNLIGDSANDSTNTQNAITYQSSDIRDTLPLLAPLGIYGGTTPTIALLAGSPAINAGNNSGAPATDQRGSARIVGSNIDMGAFEAGVNVSPASLANATSGDAYSQTLTASGGNNSGAFTFSVVGGSLPAGLSLSTNGSLSGTPSVAGTFTFIVKAADTDGTAGAIQYTLVVGCRYSINPSGQSFTSAGGNGTLNVTSGGGCSWTAQSNASWITVTTGATGSGNGAVTFSVAANTGAARSGTITVAGQTFTVTQASGCTYSLSPTSANLLSGATTGSITATSGLGCAYTAVSNNPFITITSGASGTGNGTVSYSVTTNTGAARTGTISVGGQTFTVNQAAIPTLSINSVSQKEGDGGTTPFNFTVSLSGPNNQTVTVYYETANGTATAPSDYRTVVSSVSFAPGETSKIVTILVNGDTLIEEDETFTVSLFNPTNATIAVAQGTGTIQKDDAPGDLDTSFDSDGISLTPSAIYPGNGNSIAIQSDRKIVVAGRCCNTADDGFAVLRFNEDGTPDTTFNGDGTFFLQLSTGYDIANAVAIQADNKIVLAGQSNNTFVVMRLNSDGSLDNSFNGNGKVTVNFGVADFANSLSIQPDGKIVVGGSTQLASNVATDFAVARLNPDGSLDTTFDGDGKVVTAIKPGNYDYIKGTTIQPDGKIIAVGYTQGSGSTIGALVRYNPDGSVDTSFGGQGILFDYGRSMNSVALQPDGKIIAAGIEDTPQGSSFSVFRFNTDGSLDFSFDRDGRLSTAFSQSAEAKSVLIQSDQKIVVTGTTWSYSSNGLSLSLAIARYNPNGSLDTSFDADGKLTDSLGDRLTFSTGAGLLQIDGKILVVASSASNNFYLARYKGNFVDVQCEYSLSPANQSFPSGGGTGSVTITSTFGCGWTAQSSDLWIKITGENSSTRSGAISYSVAPNTGPPRTGTINIGNKTFTVNQAASPTLSINDVTLSEGNSGTTAFRFTVTLSSANSQTVTVYYALANDTAFSPDDFLFASDLLSFAPGETSKTITATVYGDTQKEGNETFKVNLYGPVYATIDKGTGVGTILDDDICPYSITPSGVTAIVGASSGMLNLTTQAGCAWTATSNDSWLSVTNGASGSGSGTVSYSIAANTGAARTGTISIAGQIFTVNQAAPKSRKRVRFF